MDSVNFVNAQQPGMGMYPIQAQPMPMGMGVGGQTTVITTTSTGPGGLIAGAAPVWMTRPAPIPGVPPGLEYLAQIEHVLVQQQVEILEAMTGFEQANKYRVFNNLGQQCYFAFEESSTCMRLCCGTHREFTIHIVDNASQEVMRIFRPFKFCGCSGICGCCDCCNFEVRIEAPVGVPVGYAMSQCYCCSPQFVVMDASHVPQLRIEGPCTISSPCCSCCDMDFHVKSLANDEHVGKITKHWSGFSQEAFTDADNFGVSFSRDLDVHLKASMLGVLFLIDFMFFEKSGNGRDKRT